MNTVDLRLGRYQDGLADVEMVDAVITDPPYGARTHSGNAGLGDVGRATLDAYAHWTPDDVRQLVEFWAPRCRGWLACMTSHDLVMPYIEAYESAGLYPFAPVPIIQKRVRIVGDGPSSWAVYLMVARPKTKQFARWGTLPGSYEAAVVKSGIVNGGKPVDLMRALVRDYSKPGDLVCDPCAGGGTTLAAARLEGRNAIGAEMDPDTHAKAAERLAPLPTGSSNQQALFDGIA